MRKNQHRGLTLRAYLSKQLPALLVLLLLGAGLGMLMNETLARPPVAYFGWTREAQLLRQAEKGKNAPPPPAPLAAAPADIPYASEGKLLVHLFYSSSCPDCAIFRDKILPRLQETFAGHVVFSQYDTNREENVKLLFSFMDQYQVKPTKEAKDVTLKMFMYNRYLLGVDAAAARAEVEIALALAALWEKEPPKS